jgi:hypothetical protein
MTADSDPSVPKAAPAGYRYAGARIRFGALMIDDVLFTVVLLGVPCRSCHCRLFRPCKCRPERVGRSRGGSRCKERCVAVLVSWLASRYRSDTGHAIAAASSPQHEREGKPSLVEAWIRNFLTILPGALSLSALKWTGSARRTSNPPRGTGLRHSMVCDRNGARTGHRFARAAADARVQLLV